MRYHAVMSRSWLASLVSLQLVLAVACDSKTPDGAVTAEVAASASGTVSAASLPVASQSLVLDLSPQQSAAPSVKVDAPMADPKTVGRLEGLAKNGVLQGGEADSFAKVGDSPRVIVIEPGAAPTENLSYEFATGAKETSVMRMDMAMKMDMGNGTLQSFPIPQIEMRFDLKTAAKKEANGDIAVVGTVTEVKVNNPAKEAAAERAAEEMKKALAGINGMTMSYVVSPKGRSHDAKVDVPPGAPEEAKKIVEQMKHSLESMAAPLPAEPVGVGGKWVVVTRVAAGADILQWTTYTLKSKTGKKLELEALVKQLAASGEMPGAQAAPGATARITKFNSGGTGLTLMDLSRIAPDKGTGDVKSVMGFSAQNQSMTIDMTMKLAFSRK
jgi:hypothetical protein